MIQRVAAAVVITVVTVAVIGIVLLTATPLGCGPAKAMHIKLSPSSRCVTVASVASPSPTGPVTSPTPFPVFNPTPQPPPPNPNPEPASNPNPNPVPGSSNPFPDSASGGFPPFGGAASGLSAAGAPLNCRLPIYAGGPGSGGFVVFPNGNFIADPRSSVAVPSPSPGAPSPPPQYGGYPGWFGATYDRAYSRWLPVPFAWVTPDGTRYAHPGGNGIYVENVANGTSVELGEGKAWQILDVQSTGVYAVTGSIGGLWFLSFAGAATQVITTGYWTAVGGDFGFGTPTSSVPNGATNTIIRVDLKNGTTTDYFSVQSASSSVQGFDPAGNPVIYVYGRNGLEIWIGTGPNVATEIAGLNGSNFYPQGPIIADIHGLWIAGNTGIALHVNGVGWYAMSNFGGQLAGGCY
jgi:hypothetical protein